MQKNMPTKVNKTNITVGFTSPGWPLKHFPNGIVAYVQNIVTGLDETTKAIIFARVSVSYDAEDNIVNLSKLNLDKTLLQKLVDKILHVIKLPCAKTLVYRRYVALLARNQNFAILNAPTVLDIIEMEESFGVADFLMNINQIPVVTRIHGPHFATGSIMKVDKDWDYKLRVFYEGQAIMHSQGVTAPSLDVLEKVRQYYGIALPHAKVIPNPVIPVNEDMQWEIDNSKVPTILFVGRFDLLKGGDLMLKAFRVMALKNKEIELLFVGPDVGLPVGGEVLNFSSYLTRYIPEENVKKRIQFLGHCDSQAIAKLRMNSLVTVFASRYETFGISLLEALAAGCPTVATAVGGIKEIIVNNYNGLLAEPESPQDIADKVLELMDNPAKMQLLSKNAIEDCNKRFSPEVVAAQTVDYYKSVLDRL